jgi:hypothetical protein
LARERVDRGRIHATRIPQRVDTLKDAVNAAAILRTCQARSDR